MNLKCKLIIITITLLVILFFIPLVLINIVKLHDVMGIMMLLFFVVNIISAMIVNLIVGQDIKKLWWLPILFSLVFLLSYWIVLNEIIIDLMIYAFIYLILGIVFMIISYFVTKK